MKSHRLLATLVLLLLRAPPAEGVRAQDSSPLPGTRPLGLTGDIASQLVEGVDRFLLAELDKSVSRRALYWERDTSSPEKYNQSIEPNRRRLAHVLGVRDQRVEFDALELRGTTAQPPLAGRSEGYRVLAACWPAFGDVHGEGLLLVPDGKKIADVVAIPNADQTPEMITGLTGEVPAESQFARRLAESGCRVLVPMLINRKVQQRRGARLTNREFVYRPSFELGRHLIGYELHKVLASVDWFAREAGGQDAKIGVVGWGEGGMLALYAAALDTRIDVACVSGYFDRRQDVWREPIDRNVFGLLERFGDAELAAMVAPRTLIVEAAAGPQFEIPPGTGGAPGRLVTPALDDVRQEVERARKMTQGLQPVPRLELIESGAGAGPCGSAPALQAFIESLAAGAKLADGNTAPQRLHKGFDSAARHRRQMHELDRHSQWLLGESPYVRKEFMNKLDTGSLEKYEQSVEWYRKFFYDEVIGRFDYGPLPPNVRSRKAYDEPKWAGYEVVMDVFPDVMAYGILLLPKDIKQGERRPVVVCQHGLEGRPQDVVVGNHGAYHDFAAKLAERGLITFAPQNLYIFRDRFRTLQRKANPLGKTLFSIIVPQHQQIVDWLASLPQVDPQRIAFYGLSYGGKTAMRVPPLVKDYCLSICSADFNEWVWKNASTRAKYSYVWTGEYEIFEFDLGSTFNYAEMAALIAPRPFMVERGHFDGVAPDETVAYEFAKVRHLYQARLGIGDRCEIEFFVGPHTIHGQGTFDFLHRHLNWPKPQVLP
jgi:dienelactone hydrolase